MRFTNRKLVLGVSLPLLLLADVSFESPIGLTLGRDAQAIVGAPATPVSVAGVARRTTRRTVAVTTAAATTAAASTSAASQQQAATAQQQSAVAQQQAAVAQQQAAVAKQQAAVAQQQNPPAVGSVVPALPAGCTKMRKDGVEYQNCGGVTYRAAFQGNNLVYVVQ